MKIPPTPAGRQWIIVSPLAKTPSVIHALESVGETTTIGVVVFFIATPHTSLWRCLHDP